MLYGTTVNEEDGDWMMKNINQMLLDTAQNKCGQKLKFPKGKVSLEARQFFQKATEPDPEKRLTWNEFFNAEIFKNSRSLGANSGFLQ